jgi:MoxR-like ATPase
MDTGDKEMIKGLVMRHPLTYQSEAVQAGVKCDAESQRNWADDHEKDDFVRGKGEGLTFYLWGPPGTGKTLTVECLAEETGKFSSAAHMVSC